MWRDSFVCVTLIHMCESHSYGWGIHMRAVAYIFEWGIHIFQICNVIHLHGWMCVCVDDLFTHMNKSSTHTHIHAHEWVTLHIWMRYSYDAYVWCDSVVCVTRHTYEAIQVTPPIWMGYPYEWVIRMRIIAHIWVTHMSESSTYIHTHTHEWVASHIWMRYSYVSYVSRDSLICVTLIHIDKASIWESLLTHE